MPPKKIGAPKLPNKRGMTDIDRDVGIRIRALRDDQGLSQEELGRYLGVTFQQIQKYERGVNRLSSLRIILLARVLKTTPHALLGWDDNTKLVDGEAFNIEAYRLGKEFAKLPPGVISSFRGLIRSVTVELK